MDNIDGPTMEFYEPGVGWTMCPGEMYKVNYRLFQCIMLNNKIYCIGHNNSAVYDCQEQIWKRCANLKQFVCSKDKCSPHMFIQNDKIICNFDVLRCSWTWTGVCDNCYHIVFAITIIVI